MSGFQSCLEHESVRTTERNYAPWVRSRQEQLEADLTRACVHSDNLQVAQADCPGARDRPWPLAADDLGPERPLLFAFNQHRHSQSQTDL